jgi:hypothetical protein
MDLLTTHINDSQVQVITALPPISTIYKSPQHLPSPFAARRFFTSRCLVTALNSGDSSASVLTSLPSGEYPVTELYRHLFSASLAELN